MKFDMSRGLEVGDALVIGLRKFYVVSDVLSIKSLTGMVFGIMVSPVALVVFEGDQSYAFSLTEGKDVSIEDLIGKEPSLKEKLSRNLVSVLATSLT
ncbi:MAG: hypothetical protein OK439_05660 [Thaumarchaeota archaeon]|nr:hypothetical protein [Nitrososphaerota archaeon]